MLSGFIQIRSIMRLFNYTIVCSMIVYIKIPTKIYYSTLFIDKYFNQLECQIQIKFNL
jgi:hypothetical protein